MKTFAIAGLLCAAALSLGGCSEHEQKTAERSVSPLIGTWTRDGDVPKTNPDAPEFTKLSFASDGSLDAQYVAAGGAVAALVGKAPKIKSEHDTYRTRDSKTLHIAEGSSYREYDYRVSDGKLYLTAQGSSDASVFSKASDAS